MQTFQNRYILFATRYSRQTTIWPWSRENTSRWFSRWCTCRQLGEFPVCRRVARRVHIRSRVYCDSKHTNTTAKHRESTERD